nr:CHAP domain-containing protein [Anaeromonas gelatinilytica]
MKIIKYYPEITAFDELIYAWCAAFVYHCAILAGLDIPIRYKPMANTRFACVEAWLEWGKKNEFCLHEKDGFTPSRGDIIIYNNIIPPENKPENTPWYDHIGILLSVDSENIIVAEGNIDNKNISGIICRNRNERIGCYVRIPDNYEYDGWKYDYKTKKVRIQKL